MVRWCRGGLALALLAVLARAGGVVSQVASGVSQLRYNPCARQAAYRPENKARGDSFTLGVAYWNETLDNWGDEFGGKHPCRRADVREMPGLVVSVFVIEVDKLTLLTSPRADEEAAWRRAKENTNTPMLSMVLFSNSFRSQARYVRSMNTGMTIDTGIVSSLFAVARFHKGNLQYLQWQDMGCSSSCGGCIVQQTKALETEPLVNGTSCAETFQACDNDATNNDRCKVGLHFSFAGTDVNSRVMTSSTQMLKITDDFDVSSLYGKTKDKSLELSV